jgi:hypothetical protein
MPTDIVAPYSRQGRRISGYRRQRRAVMQALAGEGRALRCQGEEACDIAEEELMIAHRREDPFSGYASRSGGTNYSRWMQYVKSHPENYQLLCPRHHSMADCRIVPAPSVHRGR